MSTREPDLVTARSERRRATRYGSKLPLYVGGNRARLIDFSDTGVGFVSDEPLEPGHEITIGMRYLPDDSHPAPRSAEVVRVTSAEGGFAVGAKFKGRSGTSS
ncbi:MAG TPA: PilZ domain-containing protein [Ramlibacter sp.]|uniref:PilZ domain-containing protein n=1 Tax=Ramlibacter sp. TaxID=1917967 RepID=UPI002CB025BB|nr:PilZ domain-containing protein [Ramlibacter sp.]HVZ45550.1 PilZ domain-containing protein [Ramlibacter sp.]